MAKKQKRKKTFGDFLTTLLMLVALGVFIFSGYTLYGFYKEYKKGSDEYDNLESSYSLEDQTEDFDALEDDELLASLQSFQSIEEAEDQSGDGAVGSSAGDSAAGKFAGHEMKTVTENGKEVTLPVMANPIDFTELKSVNEDIVGWLRIRALDISYPVVQGEDNDFYLHRTFEKTDNFAGCLFMNYLNRADLTDQNTIIYGHNMKNGSMFGKLKQFREEGTYDKSKFFWIFTPDFIYQYRIFAATVVNKTGLTYQVSFTDEQFDELMDYVFEHSEIDAGEVDVTKEDRIVTLSTCTGDDSTRFAVMGKLAQVYVSK